MMQASDPVDYSAVSTAYINAHTRARMRRGIRKESQGVESVLLPYNTPPSKALSHRSAHEPSRANPSMAKIPSARFNHAPPPPPLKMVGFVGYLSSAATTPTHQHKTNVTDTGVQHNQRHTDGLTNHVPSAPSPHSWPGPCAKW